MKLVLTETMRRLESDAVAIGMDERLLMEVAGFNVARTIREQGNLRQGARVVILAGSGNNGGDGLVAAYHLHCADMLLHVYVTRPRIDDANFTRLLKLGIPIAVHALGDSGDKLKTWLETADCIVDALHGTGATPPLRGRGLEVLSVVNQTYAPNALRVAVDIPSGIHADSGEADDQAFCAELTIATGLAKPGCLLGRGAACAGEVHVVDIGLPPEWTFTLPLERTTPALVQRLLPYRPDDAHKGTFGRVLVIAGSSRYVGAAYLSATAAARAGAGLVTLAVPSSIRPIVAAKATECTFLPLPGAEDHLAPSALPAIQEALPSYSAILVGCGLGNHSDTVDFVRALIRVLRVERYTPPLVLDADGINSLVGLNLGEVLPPDTVMTPHVGELGRLLQQTPSAVEADRLRLARQCAADWGAVMLAKGAPSIVADPNGATYLNPHRNPALATAGTGDVLAGITVGLLAQGASSHAAVAGAFIHGEAGEQVRSRLGPSGLLASDLLGEIPLVMEALRE